MFGKLKDKLKSWAKKVSESSEPVEEKVEEKPVKVKVKSVEVKKEIKVKEKSAPLGVPQITEKGSKTVEKILEEVKEEKEEKVKAPSIPEPVEEKPAAEEADPGKQGFFKRITSKINKVKISEKEFEVYSNELEMLLLENNVAVEVAEKMVQRLKEEIVGKELLKKEVEEEIKDVFKEIINEILVEPFDLVEKIKAKEEKPYVVLFCGINGTGKTTTIAKIAESLKKQNLSCVLAAADTFRAASIEQIKAHGEKIGVKVIAHDYESDPAAVGFDAIEYAKKNKIDCVLIDTAGRMHTSKNLMAQIEKVARVAKPDTKIFVGESITGNDIVEQVKTFDWSVSIDGIILSKADIDEKGGTALSVGYVTKKPILYLGTGQEYDAIEPFDKQKFIKRLGL